MCSLAFVAHQWRSTFGTLGDELHPRPEILVACIEVYVHYLRDDFSSLLHHHAVANVQVELAYEVLVVQRSPPDYCAGELHGIHVGNGRDGACAPYLEGYGT